MSLIKSVFGQYGRVKTVKYTNKRNAIVEYVESKSVSRALERHYSTGISYRSWNEIGYPSSYLVGSVVQFFQHCSK